MALSGSFGKDVGAYWRLQGEWSATQNEGANTSTVTLRTYIIADQTIYGSATNGGSSTIEGTKDSFTTTSGTSAGSMRLINTQTKTITHNADGTFPDLDLAIEYDFNVTLSGTFYGNVSASTSVSLNTIPRESTLSVNANWTAGSDKTLSIKRNSSSFRHEVEMYVKNRAGENVHVQQVLFSTSETSKSTAFSPDDKKNMFNVLDGRASAPTYVILQTYKGDDWIGSNYYDGTITAPPATTVNTSHNDWDADVYYDQEIYIPLNRADSEFTHTVRVKIGSYTKTFPEVTTSVTWTPSASEQASIAAQIGKAAISRGGTIEIDTWYGGDERVQTMKTQPITFRLRGVEPKWNGTTINYYDKNATTAAITGVTVTTANPSIISGKSKVTVTLPVASRALPQGDADMVEYSATLAGKTVTMNYSASADVSFVFDEIEGTTNQAVTIRAIDSRGQSSTISKTVTVIPYNTPGLSVSAARVNGFEASTILKANGTAASIKVGGVEKNAVLSVKYRTKQAASATWGSYVTMTHTGFPGFTANDVTIQLTNTEAYNVEFVVTDRLGSTTLSRSVPTGKPLFFLDDMLNAIGVGDFPKNPNTLMMAMRLEFLSNRYASQGGGIQMNNSDILGANSIFFWDWTNSDGEGLHFPHSDWDSSTGEIPPTSQRDTLRASDGTLLLNSVPIAIEKNALWTGALYMAAGHTVTPTKKLSDCPNGWILVWSGYDPGVGEAGSHWNFTFVPKEFATLTSGGGWHKLNATPIATPTMADKYIYADNTTLKGHDRNNTGSANRQVLRYVLGF